MATTYASVTVTLPDGTTEADVDSFVAGLHVPAGSRVSVNFSAVQDYLPPEGGGTPQPAPPTLEPEVQSS